MLLHDLDHALLTPAHVAMADVAGARSWHLYPHLALLNQAVVETLSQENQFLAVELPVRHGKSVLTTVNGGAWSCLTWPHDTLMVACHTDGLMRRFGRQIRARVSKLGKAYGLVVDRKESSAANEFQFVGFDDPAFIGVSVGASPTGAGAKRIIIDDPIRDMRDIDTEAKRDALWEWYTGVLRSRLAPGGSIILVMSRWHEDDLVGRLFNPAYGTSDPWRRLHLPAIAVDEDDPLGRAPGEALCPAMGWDEETLRNIRSTVGERIWSANYQCDPVAAEGGMFRRDRWGFTQVVPAGTQLVRWWDNAATEGGSGARTAGVLLGRTPDGTWIVVDVAFGRWGPAQRRAEQRAVALQDQAVYGRVLQGAEQEPGSGGKDQAALFLTDVMAGIPATTEGTSGQSKVTRAETWAAQQQAGKVVIYCPDPSSPPAWVAEFLEEHHAFPTGSTKDMVDAAAHAFNFLALRTPPPGSLPATTSARRSMRR